MEKREQDILKKIESKTKDIKVPEVLMPEQVEKLLEKEHMKKKKAVKKRYCYGGLAVAACVVLVAGILSAGRGSGLSGTTEESVKLEDGEPADESGAGQQVQTDEGGSRKEENTDSYEKIYAYLEKQSEDSNGGFFGMLRDGFSSGSASSNEMAKESASSDEAAALTVAEGSGSSYSETNVRQEGVDEADIVKTDGRYLYVLEDDGQQIAIVDTKDGLKEIGAVEADKNVRIGEFYLLEKEQKLVYVGTVYEQSETGEEEVQKNSGESEILELGYYSTSGRESVQAVTCDIKNPKAPKEIGRISQSGYYSSSRVSGRYLYLFSEYMVDDNIIEGVPRTFIPMAGGNLVREKDITLPPFETAYMYEVITAVDLDKPSEVSDSKALFSGGGELYVSNENIYYYETNWSDSGASATSIRRLGYKDGKLSKAVKGKIKGYINDSFSIDEYKGNVRIVATVDDSNSVYVLNEKLKTIGSIKKLAKDERVYSARFMGDVGYFVTYRETDPLFSVDLSDPKNPKIIGKLKIPGFSDYLHFYGENMLLGIGMSVEEDTQVADGVKLSMFDLTDKTDVKEVNKLILKNVYSTDVSSDYKAALVEPEKNMIGFPANTEGGDRYFLFSYDEKAGFKCNLSEQINGNYGNAARGVYIEDVLYVVRGNIIEGYSLKDYKKVDDIIL